MNDIVKRVITDRSSIFLPIMQGSVVTANEPQKQSPLEKSKEELRKYMISETVPEKVRIAYALTVLADKRTPRAINIEGGMPIESMYNKNLEDTKVLIRRMLEIEEEQAVAPHP